MGYINKKDLINDIKIQPNKRTIQHPTIENAPIFEAIQAAIQSHKVNPAINKPTIQAKLSPPTKETLFNRLTNSIINPFGYDITVD
jgi:hypothetical protein